MPNLTQYADDLVTIVGPTQKYADNISRAIRADIKKGTEMDKKYKGSSQLDYKALNAILRELEVSLKSIKLNADAALAVCNGKPYKKLSPALVEIEDGIERLKTLKNRLNKTKHFSSINMDYFIKSLEFMEHDIREIRILL